MSEAEAAIKTLKGLGYEYRGGERWKPPLGELIYVDIHYSFTTEGMQKVSVPVPPRLWKLLSQKERQEHLLKAVQENALQNLYIYY